MARILLVDDDLEIVNLFLKTFEKDNHELVFCSSFSEAVRIRNQKPPDLILLDLNHPAISTMRVLPALKGRKVEQPTAIIMITERPEDRFLAISMGADDYLEKPLNSLLMRARIASVLRGRQLQDQLCEHKKLKPLSNMTLTLKHEINNPLAGIIANSQVLQMLLDDPAVQKRLSDIEQLAFRISSLITKEGTLKTTSDDDCLPEYPKSVSF